ncbi:MAG: leucyl aminopeptidase [Desulfobulbaceae bacterium]|uniref:Probable cytosol aminopeptidase n=1 Tax=Candidatus Desulfobia pelagia TaxID=2841692 RepID=A0A8J6TCN2_9BACT|nr:leucyl aminopeptidase [Candidatus Desulfobia pelagia]
MISVTKVTPGDFKGDLIAYFVRQKEKGAPVCSDDLVQQRIDRAYKVGAFKGKMEETLLIYPEKKYDGLQAGRLLIVGLGKDDLDRESFRKAGGIVSQKALEMKAESIYAVIPGDLDFPENEMAECLSEGLLLGSYTFTKYKSSNGDDDTSEVKSIKMYTSKQISAARKGVTLGAAAAEGTRIARDMAHEPGNVWTPSKFAEFGKELGKKKKCTCKVLNKAQMQKLKMGGILGVSKGSHEPPAMVVIHYRSGKKVPTLMLVGKGLTFDSGGISLKPGEGMADMKYDMCGGAAVIAAMKVIVEEQPDNVDVIAIVPASENLPGGSALKPGDIISPYGGKTVEVLNTDAEGRLILADALAYGVDTYKPDAVVDVATLTGAVIIGLGHHRTGLLANNDELAEKILKAGDRTGELLWRLPLGKEYTEQIKSKIADIKNIGGKPAGTITAAAFLQEFVGDTPWAHLDIAGTAWDYTEKSYVPKGPSGIAARTLVELVRSWQ